MRNSTQGAQIGVVELTYFLIGVILLLLLALVAKGQVPVQQPLYREYRGVRLGMTAADTRAKLGEPTMKSDEQDFYVLSSSETAQVVYDAAGKVVTISTDYTGGVGAPDHRNVVGAGLLERPDGSLYRMVMYNSERFWVSYNKSATVVPTVTVTLGRLP